MVFFVYRDQEGLWRWYLQGPDGAELADSSRSYQDLRDCTGAIALVRGCADARLEIFGN